MLAALVLTVAPFGSSASASSSRRADADDGTTVSVDPQASQTSAPPPVPVTSEPVRTLVVEARGAVPATLREAVALRLPGRPLARPGEAAAAGFDHALVELSPDGATVSLTLITAQGHAYDRVIPVAGADPARLAASTLANLVFAIEQGTVQPERTNVPVPRPTVTPKPLVDTVAPKPEPPPPTNPVPKTPRPIVLELGPALDGGVIVGLAPRSSASALVAGYGRVGLDLRLPKGLLVSFALRVGGRTAHDLVVMRTQLALGTGYALRVKSFELLAAGAVIVEPWTVHDERSRAPLSLDGAQVRARPLIGATARLSPGLFRHLTDDLAVRFGARVDLAGSFVPQNGAHSVEVDDANEDHVPRLRLGGLELGAGVELGLWFAVRERAQPRRPR